MTLIAVLTAGIRVINKLSDYLGNKQLRLDLMCLSAHWENLMFIDRVIYLNEEDDDLEGNPTIKLLTE